MSIVRDIIVILIIFILVLIALAILRPSWILKRGINNQLIDEINGGKLFLWSIVLTIIIVLIYYILKMISNGGYGAARLNL